jgi:hypothetical protein
MVESKGEASHRPIRTKLRAREEKGEQIEGVRVGSSLVEGESRQEEKETQGK